MASSKHAPAEADSPPEGFEAPEGLSAVGNYEDARTAHEAGLAILAMGRAYWTLVYGERYVLCVRSADAAAAERELAEVARLRRGGARRAGAVFTEHEVGRWSFALYVAVLIAGFAAQRAWAIDAAGRTDALAIIDGGEWWRAVTALTLHADIVHLVSNTVAGAGFAIFVARFFGAAAGWLLILLSGVAGNLLNAWIHFPEPHLSIGASTAVFGAVGLLTGIGIWAALAEPRTRLTIPRWLVPVLGGLTLLGWLGVGDYRTDVAAHICGFLCGTVFGVAGAFARRAIGRLQPVRACFGALPLVVVGGAWLAAWFG